MKVFWLFISYLFHPLFVPTIATLAYFKITPKYAPESVQSSNIIPIFILTVVVPIIAYFILKNIGMASSFDMPKPKERRYSLYASILLLGLIVVKIIPGAFIPELYYFFLGLIVASLGAILLLFFNYRASIHVLGAASILMYLITLSIHFERNLVLAISAITLIVGLVASSRLYLGAHTRVEVFLGLLLGLTTQLLTIKFWL
jgi:membrane-associated phospholipid phosphatase